MNTASFQKAKQPNRYFPSC